MNINKRLLGLTIAGAVITMNISDVNACGLGVQEFKTTANLNLRLDKNTHSQVLLTMPKGTTVVPIEKSSDGNWVKVKYNGKTGWCSYSYLKMRTDQCTIPDEDETVQESNDNNTYFIGVVKANILNLRADPNTNSRIRAKLPKGTKLDIKYGVKNDTWLRVEVKINGRTEYGYVSTDYVG